MSWRFRQSFKIIPGLKLNLSKSGLSASVGGAPFTVNLGSADYMARLQFPEREFLFANDFLVNPIHTPQPNNEPYSLLTPNDLPESGSSSPPMREIRSASTEQMTSESLKELKTLIQTAYEEHEEISREFSKAKQEDTRATLRFNSWDGGFLFKKLFKNAFVIRKTEAEIASARACELEEQLRLTTISTQVELANEQAEPFFKMRDDFTSLKECGAIWDVKAERRTDKMRERTIASGVISRERINLSLGGCDFIQWEQEVPHLQNANGGDIFLYPGFILYRASKTAFSVIDFHDVKLLVAPVKFHEVDGVPNDSKVVGQTWAKTNKDGTRDKRFADNHQIPIALYGELTLKSETGLWEKFMFSNPERLERFVKSWNTFVISFDHRISLHFDQDVTAPSAVAESPVNSTRLVGTDIHFECHLCKQPVEVNAEAVGQEFRCPGCGEKLVVPEISD